MKKTNRTFKRFAAITSASLLAACAVAPLATGITSSAATDKGSITISNSTTGHTYEAYQIFDGDLSDKILSNITWGTGINYEAGGFFEALSNLDLRFAKTVTYTINDSATDSYNTWKNDQLEKDANADVSEKAYYNSLSGEDKTSNVTVTKTDYTAEDTDAAKKIAEALVSYGDAASFAEVIGNYLTSTKEESSFSSNIYTIGDNDLADGYYLVKDKDNSLESNSYDAYTAYIVKVAGTVANIEPKSEIPSIEKEVLDETTDAESGATEGWGETADHAINETFQFRLTASVPGGAYLKEYETYKLVFNDTMSNGVTYEGIKSVKVNGSTIESSSYELGGIPTDAGASMAGLSWTLTIDDVKSIVGDTVWGVTPFTVEVIYNAHLNENAILSNVDVNNAYSTGDTANINNNNVYLQYSNNPNVSADGSSDDLGKTTDDTVGVFTFRVNNTKIDGGDNSPLPNATFKLYSDEACTTEIALGSMTKDSKTVYVPLGNGGDDAIVTAVNAMKSDTNGTFDIIGLDVGTYYVKEISTPAGYNLIEEPWTINITAEHEENEAGTGAKLDITSNAMSYTYENNKGSTLPGTGGIGTTIFYLGGGAMAAIGGVYLISKRRMKKSEE